MSREETLSQITQVFGIVPGYFANAPDQVLEQLWAQAGFTQIESALSPRDKLLVGYGASAAIHCEY
jgi:hypothetical protein